MSDFTPIPHPSFWENIVTVNSGETLAEMAEEKPVMLVFLRFFGCSFCREAISDIAKRRKKLEASGVRIVMVHMAAETDLADKFFKRYKLFPIDHVSDPARTWYQAFGLGNATPQQLFGFMNWIRGFQASVLEGHGATFQDDSLGDGFQMPGVFVLHKGEIKSSFIHKNAYDRPDYEQICSF
ncbi:MAG: AhpC/TSA family protein [Chitinophagales bacterium]|jgi:peroxiredoxin|nr:AhpC/TSA family protein [Chitinophagales bacterium]